MKKLFLILTALAPVFTACAQITNGVKVSALTGAALPLTGNEIVPLVQLTSGTNATRAATVNNILQSATTLANAAQTYAASASNILSAYSLSESNANRAYSLAASNDVASKLFGATNTFRLEYDFFRQTNITTMLALNALQDAKISDLTAHTNLYYPASNPANYQSAAQVQSTVNSAIAAGGTVTNGGFAQFPNIATPALDLGGLTVPSSGSFTTNVFIDLSAAAFQRAKLAPRNSNTSSYNFMPSNAVDGVNVWLLVEATNNVGYNVAGISGGTSGFDNWSGGTIAVSSTTRKALLNWQVIGTNIIFTIAGHP